MDGLEKGLKVIVLMAIAVFVSRQIDKWTAGTATTTTTTT